MRFVALDVETANARFSSVCEIGVVVFEGEQVVDRWQSYLDPNDYFSEFNTLLHGIDEHMVSGLPTYADIHETLRVRLEGEIVAIHTKFDAQCLFQAAHAYGLSPIVCNWLDTAMVARRAWPECAHSGYGLKALTKKIGHKFKHHSAVEDAEAAGKILVSAIKSSGIDPSGWVERVRLPLDLEASSQGRLVKRDGHPDGALYGESVVFTGALSMMRSSAANLASSAGCNVEQSVTKRTTILCVGDQDINKLAGYDKSKKHRSAEEKIRKGQEIRILAETDFISLVNSALKSE